MKKALKNVGSVLKKCFSGLKRILVKFLKSFGAYFLRNQKKIAKYVICTSAVLHLLLSSIQIQAINRLSNQLCGLVMFLFVLLGFVCLFNAIRLKDPKGSKIVFSILMLLVVIGIGGYLVSIYFDALMHQRDIVAGPVIGATVLSIIVLTLYLFGLVGTIVACVYYHMNLKKEKKIVNA